LSRALVVTGRRPGTAGPGDTNEALTS